jgi:hypothetical protein
MAESKACAKCQLESVVVVPFMNVTVSFSVGIRIRTRFFSGSGVPINLHVCTSCGFAEQWADTSDEDFPRLNQKFRPAAGTGP